MPIPRKEENRVEEPNMTPMIDVIFQLLIFFMCSIQFKTLEGKMTSYLPKDKGMQATPSIALLNEVGVYLDLDQATMRTRFSVGNTRFDDFQEFLGTVVRTYRSLEAAQGADPNRKPVVKIRPDPRVPFRDVVRVLDSCKAQNPPITNVEFEAGAPPKG